MRTLLLFLFIGTSLVAPAQTREHFRMAEVEPGTQEMDNKDSQYVISPKSKKEVVL